MMNTKAKEITIQAASQVDVTVYEVYCVCGNTMKFTVEADGDGDLLIEVGKCDDCITEAYDNGVSDGEIPVGDDDAK